MHQTEYEITPSKQLGLGLKEIWEQRELLYFFTWRDIKVKYKQTALGFIWAVLQPTAMMFIFTFALGRAISNDSQLILEYPLFVLSGLIIWGVFSSGVINAGNSMVANASIIKKIYFPRLIIPLSAVFVALFDFLMALPVFCAVLLFYHRWFNGMSLVYIPAAVGLTCFSTFGLGTLLAALNLKYRDFRYLIPFLIQALLFLSPVIFPSNHIQYPFLRYVMAVNPMSCPLDLFRMSISDFKPDYFVFACSAVSSLFFLIAGLFYFRKTEFYFADLA